MLACTEICHVASKREVRANAAAADARTPGWDDFESLNADQLSRARVATASGSLAWARGVCVSYVNDMNPRRTYTLIVSGRGATNYAGSRRVGSAGGLATPVVLLPPEF